MIKEITKAALEEIKKEDFREKVELEKQRIRMRKGIFKRLFPFKIKIVRR